MKHTGHGGNVVFGSVTVNVGAWDWEQKARLGETTNSGSGGNATFVPGPKEVSGKFSLPWDDAALVSTGGYVAGASGAATFKLGDSSLTITGPILIESCGFEDDNVSGDPVKVNIGYRGNGAFVIGG